MKTCHSSTQVSILARRTRRAQHSGRAQPPSPITVSILARRTRRAQPPNSPVTAVSQSRFNPRPPHAAGATIGRERRIAGATGFNPRPPHAAGATRARRGARVATLVSILARRTRRAQLPRTVPGVGAYLFQSSPAARGGRNRRTCTCAGASTRFNPRPPHAAGATVRRSRSWLVAIRFNPRPPHAAGATADAADCYAAIEHVSILARRTRRAQPYHGTQRVRSCAGFNPRPPHAAGATQARVFTAQRLVVSILARRTRRAQQSARLALECAPASFNPRPPHAAGATRARARP